jgi:predicted DNA-binding antitoxin AbrB/MazE fold protein
MSEQVEAIYDHGVLKPLTPLTLPDQSRVRLTVDALSNSAAVETSTGGDCRDGFDEELDSLLFDGPSLPADFSRADIYADHD